MYKWCLIDQLNNWQYISFDISNNDKVSTSSIQDNGSAQSFDDSKLPTGQTVRSVGTNLFVSHVTGSNKGSTIFFNKKIELQVQAWDSTQYGLVIRDMSLSTPAGVQVVFNRSSKTTTVYPV